jgi:LPS-assembly protein
MKQKTGYMRKRHCSNSCLLHKVVPQRAYPRSTLQWLSVLLKVKPKILCYVFLFSFSSNALSEESTKNIPSNCAANNESSTKHFKPPIFEVGKQDHTKISADATRTDKQGSTELTGNVVIEKHELRISADNASYNQDSKDIEISGKVHVDTKTMSFDADQGTVSNEKGSTSFNEVQFFAHETGMRGKASSIVTGDDKTTELQNASITSCDPDNPGWRLNADNINLDHEDEYGSADNVVLRFQEVPFLYLPYMEFPLGDRRRSGILAPELGDSSSRGTELAVPWYWNIAPNQDATLAPHYMSKRGTGLDAQYRFLTQSTNGQIDGAFLPDDDITGENRYQFEYQQHTRFTQQLKMDIDVQDVSDERYLDDFSSNLSTSSTTHIKRDIKLNYDSEYWRARGLAQTLETLDTTILPSDKPYRRLPQVTLEGKQPLGDAGLAFTLDSEWVDFGHEDDTVVTGSRFTVKPGLHWLTSGPYWFIDPAVKFSHTQYDVEDGNGTKQDLDDRNVSMSSLDAGLFFERDLDSGLVQTLEPQIFYLNVPFRDQDSLPDFDTSVPTFNIAQLFRDNRFNGGDRIGDANQVTLALSSRLISPTTGDEYLRASLGQIIYFEDRKVTLNAGPVEDSRESDLIGELSGNWNDWSLTTSVQWNTETHSSERENFLLHYQSDKQHIFNLGLRTDKTIVSDEIRQTDLSFVAPISNDFSTFGRWNYSLEDNRDIEVIAGITYDSCCWSVQLLGQRHLNTSTASAEEYENAFMIQLVFKGMGSVSGKKVSNTLEHAILGYDEEY